ncbi:sugar phosphate isomerase/epimerase family protein [Castellaniella sp.]|uniref:sugar phosphate isomerase/epimerase family protein n=1 Tax=Castellaniella sp. TaxID=1955812 RepID=UPI002AFE710D|nr:sugar phosphate isomerase/epimerase family protein [Castellaniella sp.]
MKLAISNIAWNPEQTEAVYELLHRLGVHGLEVAPGLLFDGEPNPLRPSDAVLKARQARLKAAGLQLVSMQSLLFGAQDAKLFGDAGQVARFRDGMLRAIELAGLLRIPNLVVGSPANRVIPEHMAAGVAIDHAANLFTDLAEVAQAHGCRLAMEPNPAVYGTNFLTHMADAATFVRRVAHPAVTLNFDVGALHLNGEFDQIDALLAAHLDIVSHVHISEPHLAPVPADEDTLRRTFSALTSAGWTGCVSIEMRAVHNAGLTHVEHALRACLESMVR